MNPHRPSRRQLLMSFLASLFGWLWPGKAKAAPPPPSKPILIPPYHYPAQPVPIPPYPYQGPLTRRRTTYDALGRIIKEELLPPEPEPVVPRVVKITREPGGGETLLYSYD